jgi:hypothetical protein
MGRLSAAMSDQFQIFEVFLERRRRGAWRWSVCSTEGKVIMQGSDNSRPAARYNANRALLLLLLTAPYRSNRHRISDGSGYAFLGRQR